LNSLGIPTTGSCEGHIDRGSPAPWVKVTPSSARVSGRHDSGERESGIEAGHIRKKALECLSTFYEKRNVPHDVRLEIEKAHSGFWIHNGGESYRRWRTYVNKNALKMRDREKIERYFSVVERSRRSTTLSAYQREVQAFAEFLKKRTENLLDLTSK